MTAVFGHSDKAQQIAGCRALTVLEVQIVDIRGDGSQGLGFATISGFRVEVGHTQTYQGQNVPTQARGIQGRFLEGTSMDPKINGILL